MISISKNIYIDKFTDIVNKCNNIYHSTIKMKSANVKCSICIDFGIKNNDKDPKFVVGEHVRILKYKNIFAKDFVPNWSEGFLIKKVKILFRMLIT